MQEPVPVTFNEHHRDCLVRIFERIRDYYGQRLVSLVVFGSYARGNPRLNSDLDLLIVLEAGARAGIPRRTAEFLRNVELPFDEDLQALHRAGISMELSPTILTTGEACRFLPIYLDMTAHSLVLEDRSRFFSRVLERVRAQMIRWGSRRTESGGHWLWEIRPNLKWNEVVRYDE